VKAGFKRAGLSYLDRKPILVRFFFEQNQKQLLTVLSLKRISVSLKRTSRGSLPGEILYSFETG